MTNPLLQVSEDVEVLAQKRGMNFGLRTCCVGLNLVWKEQKKEKRFCQRRC